MGEAATAGCMCPLTHTALGGAVAAWAGAGWAEAVTADSEVAGWEAVGSAAGLVAAADSGLEVAAGSVAAG